MELKFRRPRAGSGDFARHLRHYIDSNRLTLLTRGGQVYRAMWQAIEQARETVHIETYILASDRTGREFSKRLEAKAREGVRVRVIYDAIGSMGIDPAFVGRMRNAGVQFLEYHPVAPWRPRWAWNRRDHRKSLIVDSRAAFTGGVNLCDDHAPIEEQGRDWRDVHVMLEGPAAHELDRIFRATWYKETRRWFPLDVRAPAVAGASKVWVAANDEFLYRYRIRSAYLSALRAARKEVLIANAYFVPDRRTSRALAAAARRGVSVRVLVQGVGDLPAVWRAGRAQYDYLLRHGVRLYEWHGPTLHAKTAVVDETWCTAGSYNMDHRSLLMNLEVNLHVLDARFAARLAQALRGDMEQSRELTLEAWRRRPLSEKLLERWWQLFRYFF